MASRNFLPEPQRGFPSHTRHLHLFAFVTAMHTLKPVASSTLSLPTDNYIYSIVPSAPGTFAAISSDDSLRVFDASLNSSVLSTAAHAGVTSLRRFDDSLLATGGRDGKVKMWDVRAGKPVVEMQTGEFIVAKLFFSFFWGFFLVGMVSQIG